VIRAIIVAMTCVPAYRSGCVSRVSRSLTSFAAGLLLAIVAALAPPEAHAQIYKCTDATGKTAYADAPCDSAARPLKLQDDAKALSTSPTACAQLQDEMQRLAAEADRAAKRGHPESAQSAKRRQSLTRQYEARCIGIHRAPPSARPGEGSAAPRPN